jgi:DNA-directed RNA polymerase subunit RPC12/RpoP
MFIVIPVGREWTVTKQGRARAEYRCQQCNLTTPVSLLAEGVGSGLSALFLNDAKAQQEASTEASKAVAEDVRLSLRLMRCPGCGVRDGKAVAKVMAEAAGPALGYALLACFIWGPVALMLLPWLPANMDLADMLLIGGLVVVFAAAFSNTLRRRYQRRMVRAREGVRFGDEAEVAPEEDVASPAAEVAPQPAAQRGSPYTILDKVPDPEPLDAGEGVPCRHCGTPNLPAAEFCRQCLGAISRAG